MFSISFSLLSAPSYVPLFPTYSTYTTITTSIIACSLLFSAYNLFANNNICSLDLYNEDLQATIYYYYYYSSSALSCPFRVQHNESNERSWSRRFVFSPSQEFCRDYIVICTHFVVYAFAYLFIVFSLMLVVFGFLGGICLYSCWCSCVDNGTLFLFS